MQKYVFFVIRPTDRGKTSRPVSIDMKSYKIGNGFFFVLARFGGRKGLFWWLWWVTGGRKNGRRGGGMGPGGPYGVSEAGISDGFWLLILSGKDAVFLP